MRQKGESSDKAVGEYIKACVYRWADAEHPEIGYQDIIEALIAKYCTDGDLAAAGSCLRSWMARAAEQQREEAMYNSSDAGFAPACYGCRWRDGFECRVDYPRLSDDGTICGDRQTEPPRRRKEDDNE